MAGKKKAASGLALPKLNIKTVLILLVAIALSVTTWIFFVSPQRAKQAEVTAQVTSLQSDLDANNQRITDIKTGQRTGAADLYDQAVALDRQVPAAVDRLALVSEISRVAAREGVVVQQMDPVTEPTSGGGGKGQTQTFKASLSGSPAALSAVLGDLRDYPSILTVSGLAMTLATGAPATANFTLDAHYASSPAIVSR